MQPNNLTALDFEDIKSSIKSYLRTRTEFSDYDFDGSALSYLIDMLAYNTYYTSFNANMALNEVFLQSSTVRDNVVNISKLLNYTPRSISASKACLKLNLATLPVNGVYPSSITLKSGAVCTGGNFIWNILNDITVAVNTTTGAAEFDNVTVYEGSVLNFTYVVNTFARQVYTIPSQNVDIDTLTVKIKSNESSTSSDIYSKVDIVTNLTATSKSYFVSEGEDMRYEVKFGDDSVGRAVKDGEVIDLQYLTTSGAEANEVSRFSFIGRFVDSFDVAYGGSVASVTVKERSQQGSAAETIESIKYNAPRFYASQYRAVTAQDYALITKNIYSNAETVVAYGGDSLNPPIYGKVFITVRTKTGSTLNDITKKQLSSDLRKYAMAAIDPVIVDPDNIYIYTKVFALYDTGSGSNSSSIKTNIQNAITKWANQVNINNFNSTFKSQDYQRAIGLSDSAISDVSVQTTLLKYIEPTTNQTNTYCISTGSALYNSAPSQDAGDGTCKKEPILISGTFRTFDRPGVDQQFEDDGFGNLRTYYNSGTKKVYTNDNAGTVNYDTGKVCFGPINIIGAGVNITATSNLNITDSVTGAGLVIDLDQLPNNLQIPVLLIPANSTTIPASTPGTIINIINPEVTVAPIGTTPPTTIPLNSLTPSVFNSTPTTIELTPLDNSGSVNTSSCF
ncbi:baseplate wedge subunit [Cyanophage S-RIM12_RW_25_0210]|uniref:Baseplate wedge subunit n=1 Tax=Cyanophage S-RIM12_RW_25_0210 TaxID=2928616 RepID=A0A1D7SUT3_9CAUD|nr:baseplate wedge subunit [Cyanophage S-RIM12_RW_25_0210]